MRRSDPNFAAKSRVLDALRRGGTLRQAAKKAGVPPSSVYRWTDRDLEFAYLVQKAKGTLKDEQRNQDGWQSLRMHAADGSPA